MTVPNEIYLQKTWLTRKIWVETVGADNACYKNNSFFLKIMLSYINRLNYNLSKIVYFNESDS